MSPDRPDSPAGPGRAEKRSPHSIRFLDPEWRRIEAFAEARGLAPAEFVRFATLAAMADGADPVDRLAPLIERTFRAAYILSTRLRDEMLEAGKDEELKALVDTARALQDELLNGAPGRDSRQKVERCRGCH